MEKIYDLIIIGGGPAGLSSAIYAGRAKLDTLVIEKGEMGGQITSTSEVVNYPGIKEISGTQLGILMRDQAKEFGAEFLKSEVLSVNLKDDIKEVKTTSGDYRALSVIIATGATPRKLGFPGEKEFTGRGVAYCATCDGEFFTGLDVFVIGAGFAAAEEAIFLTKFAKKVTIIAREPEFTCAKTIADKVLANPKIEVKFNSELLKVEGDTILKKATFKNNVSGETWEYISNDLEGFGVFVFIGYKPQSDLFKDILEVDNGGYIVTDENLQTNIEGIFAVGDIRPKKLRQVVTAVSDGAIAATVIEKLVEEKREKLGIEKNVIYSKEEKNGNNLEDEDSNRFFDENIVSQLKEIFKKFNSEVNIITILNETPISNDIKIFLTELSNITPKLKLHFYSQGENLEIEKNIEGEIFPTIALFDKNEKYTGIKFSGLPSGHELNSFILALYAVAGPGQELSEDIKSRVKKIDKKVNIKIAVSLSCSLCPQVVSGAQRIAVENENISAEMIDIMNFKEIKKKYSLMGVPALILNDKEISFGSQSIEDIILKIEKL